MNFDFFGHRVLEEELISLRKENDDLRNQNRLLQRGTQVRLYAAIELLSRQIQRRECDEKEKVFHLACKLFDALTRLEHAGAAERKNYDAIYAAGKDDWHSKWAYPQHFQLLEQVEQVASYDILLQTLLLPRDLPHLI